MNLSLVNNTGTNLPSSWTSAFLACVNDGADLPEDIADLFCVQVLLQYNGDGSNRGLIDWA